ncbi:MAG: NADAR family protein [Candidatus Marinimicrobia bacterium]|nr:NADAR family protein [Candidatus Neomarinimicrobiota bacterium]
MLGERITDTHIYFWNGIFCQWSQYTMVEEDITYYSCEQYMMAKKAKLFNDEKVYDMIMSEEYPSVQKELGRMVSNYNQDVWDKHKFDIVVNANYLKFTQDETLKELLLDTGDKTIVEASPYDTIWGIGLSCDDDKILDESNWQGENLLGKAIMKVRTILNENCEY